MNNVALQQIELRPVESLIPYSGNARTHSQAQVKEIAASIREFGFNNPILLDKDGGIIAGHGRLAAAQLLGLENAPTLTLAHLTDAQRRAYILADNRIAMNASWDLEMLKGEFERLMEDGVDLKSLGFDDSELAILDEDGAAPLPTKHDREEFTTLAQKFLVPPFSTFNAREGWWLDRKKAWLALGIKSEEGRDAPPGGSPDLMQRIRGKAGTSIFDPVVCELAYRWFCPADGLILDPFSGGSVRGIVASKLGRQYIGHELRQEQVDANREQASEICGDEAYPPAYIQGDSRNIDTTCADVQADFVFSCPPYGDLEVYSDDPADISAMDFDEFLDAYREIIFKACGQLKMHRFAAFVVGDFRDRKGNYRNFVGETVEAFRAAGLDFYNDAILLNQTGTVAMRAGRTFSQSRKLGKAHQNVLVFVKGDARLAAQACGEVDVSDAMFAAEGQQDDEGVSYVN